MSPNAARNVKISPGDFGLEVRKTTDCMSIDEDVLKAAPSYSKAGLSAESKLGASKAAKTRVSGGYLTMDQYASLFDKYYATNSVMDQVLAKDKALKEQQREELANGKPRRPQSASASMSRSITLQSGTAERAVIDGRNDRMAELQVDKDMHTRTLREAHAGSLPASVARKYGVQGVATPPTMGPARNPPLNGLSVVLAGGIPTGLATNQGDSQSAAKIMELAAALQEAERMRAEAAARVAKRRATIPMAPKTRPQSASAAFRTTSRDQHERTGKYGVQNDPGIPHVGWYHPKHLYCDPHVAGVNIRGSNTNEGKALMKPPAGYLGEDQLEETPVPIKAAHDESDRAVTVLFKDAHKVHPNKPRPMSGTTSFKAAARPSPQMASTANHLFNAYWHEGMYSGVTKNTKGGGQAHVLRAEPGTTADTPPSLGPGSYYLNPRDIPPSHTGRHVTSAHDRLSSTVDFSKHTARPGSAKPPPQRPASASVTTQDAQAALNTLFGEHGSDLDPSSLISVHHLEELSSKSERRPIRSASARSTARADVGVGQQGSEGLQGQQRPHQGTYIGLNEIQKYSSAGLMRTVPGGRISSATRQVATKGLRVMATDWAVPPASGPLRMGAGVDLGTYEPKDESQAHRLRSHTTTLPPNRSALSKHWVQSTAMAYI